MNYKLAFLPHFILKAVVLTLYLFSGQITSLINNEPTYELISIFLVVDFWVTKNINGRKMIGIRWFFENDEYGVERFKFECRANPELTSSVNARLFWIVLVPRPPRRSSTPSSPRSSSSPPSSSSPTSPPSVPPSYRPPYAAGPQRGHRRQQHVQHLLLLPRQRRYPLPHAAAGERQEKLRQDMGLEFVRGMEDATIVSYL